MSKKISKIVAMTLLLTACSSFGISSLSVYAAEMQEVTLENDNNTSSSKELLSLDKSIDYAIENSDKLKLYDTKLDYQEKIDDANEKLEKANKEDSDDKEYNSDTRELNIKTLKQNKEIEEDKIKKQATDSYKAIVSTQAQIDNLQKQYDLQKKKIDDTKLMNNLEMTTYIDVEDLETNLQTLKNSIDSSKDTLNDLKASFKNLIGKDVSDYKFDNSISYTPFKIEENEDKYFDNIIDEYLKYKKESLELNEEHADDIKEDEPEKFDQKKPKESDFSNDANAFGLSKQQKYEMEYKQKLEDYLEELRTNKADEKFKKPNVDEIKDDVVGKTALQKYQESLESYTKDLNNYVKSVSARIKYLQAKVSVEDSKVELAEQKKNLKDALKKYYTLLKSKESDISLLRQKIDLSKEKSNHSKQKYDLGLITQYEYDTSVVDTDKLLIDLRKTVDEYDSTKEKIEKPWIG